MKTLINSIMNRLAAEVPELNFIDINLGQLQLEPPPVDFPCALVDLGNVDYESSRNLDQKASATVTIALGFNVMAPASLNSTPELRELALIHYDVIDKVAQALHCYKFENCTPLIRQNLVRQAETYPRHYVISFRTTFHD